MTLPASLQSIRSLPQFLTVVGDADANADGYLQKSEAESLFLPEEQSQFGSWFLGADSQYDNQLRLSEIAESMRRSGPPLNKLFSPDVVKYLKNIQDFKFTTESFTPLRAEWVNDWVDNLQNRRALGTILVATARILNWMSDEGHEGEKFCRSYIDALSPQALFLLLSIAGSDLWPPLFAQVADRFEALPNMEDVIKAADPNSVLLPKFFLRMVAYGRGRHYLAHIKPPIYTAVTNAVRSEDIYNIPRFLPALDALAKFSKETAGELGNTLLHDYNGGDQKLKMGFQFLLHALKKYWHSPEVKAVAADQSKLYTPPVPSSWLADGVLWAEVVFDFDQKVHRDRMLRMFQQKGFTLTRLPNGERSAEEVVLEKTVNGVVLHLDVMYAPTDKFNVSDTLRRNQVDMMSLRAHHSSALRRLSECRNCEMASKLVFNGGCTGIDNVPELMRAYRGNFFIADKDIGKGHDNSLVLYYVMHAIAGGATDWEQVHRVVKAHVPVNQWGLLLPDDDLLKFYYTLDAPVYLSEVKDPFADQSSWALNRNAVEPMKKKKGKIKWGKVRIFQP